MATDFTRKTLERLELLVATGFGSGCLPVAPGTWGSLVGVLWFLALWKLNCFVPGVIVGLALSIVTACVGERHFARKDPPQVVVDEMACFPLAMLGLPVTMSYLAVAFVIFRILDVVKPQPAHWVQRWPGGWGITADDVVAALYTCGALHAIRWVAGLQGGGASL
ncbi:MAG TPA: phosphatidylglycerophosphatase A [Candidatus Omnitrophica bacterium]|nr:phosphatidylglycerophosphatase A [Candidatus Omnitrophota bacterium]